MDKMRFIWRKWKEEGERGIKRTLESCYPCHLNFVLIKRIENMKVESSLKYVGEHALAQTLTPLLSRAYLKAAGITRFSNLFSTSDSLHYQNFNNLSVS
jgi:hypothetical protein